MPYCEYCGDKLDDDAKYCPSCGAPAPRVEQQAVPSESSGETYENGQYSVLLVSLGNCPKSTAADLLEDTLGYSAAQAKELLTVLPAEAARNLTRQQALYLSQALDEYGIEVSVWDENGYVDLGQSATETVYKKDGSFLETVISVLGALTAANRVVNFSRWNRNIDNNWIFRSQYRRPPEPPRPRKRLFSLANLLGFGRKNDPVPPHPQQRWPDSVPGAGWPARGSGTGFPGFGSGRRNSGGSWSTPTRRSFGTSGVRRGPGFGNQHGGHGGSFGSQGFGPGHGGPGNGPGRGRSGKR